MSAGAHRADPSSGASRHPRIKSGGRLFSPQAGRRSARLLPLAVAKGRRAASRVRYAWRRARRRLLISRSAWNPHPALRDDPSSGASRRPLIRPFGPPSPRKRGEGVLWRWPGAALTVDSAHCMPMLGASREDCLAWVGPTPPAACANNARLSALGTPAISRQPAPKRAN